MKLRKHLWIPCSMLALCAAFMPTALYSFLSTTTAAAANAAAHVPYAQQNFPPPPADRSLIYIMDEKGALAPLPFETGSMPIKTDVAAKSDKVSYVELKGAKAANVVATDEPRLYLFVADRADVHPPFLVQLTGRRDARRVTAITQRGLRGFAIASEEIVKPHYRVLARADGTVYMEIRPRVPLLPGEYAIVGTDLQRIATFRVAMKSNP